MSCNHTHPRNTAMKPMMGYPAEPKHLDPAQQNAGADKAYNCAMGWLLSAGACVFQTEVTD